MIRTERRRDGPRGRRGREGGAQTAAGPQPRPSAPFPTPPPAPAEGTAPPRTDGTAAATNPAPSPSFQQEKKTEPRPEGGTVGDDATFALVWASFHYFGFFPFSLCLRDEDGGALVGRGGPVGSGMDFVGSDLFLLLINLLSNLFIFSSNALFREALPTALSVLSPESRRAPLCGSPSLCGSPLPAHPLPPPPPPFPGPVPCGIGLREGMGEERVGVPPVGCAQLRAAAALSAPSLRSHPVPLRWGRDGPGVLPPSPCRSLGAMAPDGSGGEGGGVRGGSEEAEWHLFPRGCGQKEQRNLD